LEILIQNALKPAQIAIDNIFPNEESHSATVVVDEEQQSLAIGKKGQNVRLASKLCGWEIDIKTRAELEAEELARQGKNPSLEEESASSSPAANLDSEGGPEITPGGAAETGSEV